MAAWVNQHSFFLAAVAVWIAVAVLLLRDGFRPMDGVALAALALASWAAYALLRPAAGAAGEAEAVRAQIGAGRPVLLEFQSPY
jgi:hypothetical protein